MRYKCYWEKWHEGKYNRTRKMVTSALTACGYKEIPTCNGGDDDRIIMDTKRKEWAYFEYGFTPFACDEENYPTDRNLTYWYRHSR